jgi:DNA-directed RNA polymerase subunit RPC12/RpoP
MPASIARPGGGAQGENRGGSEGAAAVTRRMIVVRLRPRMETTSRAPSQHQFPCRSCGANLEFAPGTSVLTCPYCGATNPIATARGRVEELDYHAHLARLAAEDATIEAMTVRCGACGAQTTLPPNETAGRCPFCASPVVAGQAQSQRLIKPRSLLPFHVTRRQAMEAFQRWIEGLWFAPGSLRRAFQQAAISGVYLPAWTYDADTESDYTGERGEDYWDTQSYTVTINGRTERRTRQVRRTRWYPASGTVWNRFDDVLVIASDSLPRRYTEALEPWDLRALQPYQEQFLAGFVAESYRVDLQQGFELAQRQMQGPIHASIRRDIGGDHQRIHSVHTRYDDITFKHILLPVWISAYHYQQRTFRFLVNARTGEVQGERPYSWIKIALFALMCLIAAAIIVLAVARMQ